MKAVIVTRFGDPEVLSVGEVPEPVAGPGQELVKVEVAGLNFADVTTARWGYQGVPKPPFVAGREFCGLRQSDGKPVMGYTQWGAFAERTTAAASLLWPLPLGWSPQEGAAFPVNYFTAYLAYWKAGLLDRPSSGSVPRVLIHAVAGGVGTAAVQIGRLLGFEMYGTSSSDTKLARARELGLEHAINYKRDDYEQVVQRLTRGEGVDVVLEMLGGEHTAKSLRCLRDFGRVIVYGSATGHKPQFDVGALYAKGASVHGLWLTYLSRNAPLMDQAWERLSDWIRQGHLHPVVAQVFPLERVQEAYRLLLEGRNVGKAVLELA